MRVGMLRFSSLIGICAIALAGCKGVPSAPAPAEIAQVAAPSASRLVDEAGVYGEYFPGAAGPAVLLFGGSEGGLGKGARADAAALNAAGFSVLQIAFYRAPGQPENLELVPLETFDLALDWLETQPGVDAARIGIMGTSKGGEAALIAASRHPELAVVVAGVPSSAAWQGINWTRDARVPEASWSLGGAPYPALPYGEWDNATGLYSLYANGLKALGDHPDAVIRVETIGGPVLLVCGEVDALWPSCEMSRQVKVRSEAMGGPEVTVLAYPEGGHGVVGVPDPAFDPATSVPDDFGGTGASNEAARADSWPRIVAFFRDAL